MTTTATDTGQKELPAGWKWVKLGDVVLSITNGCTVKQNREGKGNLVSRIETISSGEIENANKLLSRNWQIQSKVERGRQLGKKIGFPTCNMSIKDYVIAKEGVYAVKIYKKNKKSFLTGIANLGYRPTFKQKKLLLEVHIFNYSGNLYNKYLTIEFISFIRKEKKFKNINQLKKQINLDIKITKKKLN